MLSSARQIEVLVRPEHLQLCGPTQGIPATVIHSSFRGTRKLYTLQLSSGAVCCALFPSECTPHSGEHLRIAWCPDDLVMFPVVQ